MGWVQDRTMRSSRDSSVKGEAVSIPTFDIPVGLVVKVVEEEEEEEEEAT